MDAPKLQELEFEINAWSKAAGALQVISDIRLLITDYRQARRECEEIERRYQECLQKFDLSQKRVAELTGQVVLLHRE